MTNDTFGQILSLTLPTGEAFAFYLVEPSMTTEYAPIASADMFEDAILSLHTLDTCVRRAFTELTGPLSLEPGHAYTIRVADDFIAEIVEDAMPEPFVGLRVIIKDPAKASAPGAMSTLSLSDGELGDLLFEDVYGELPAPFLRVDASTLILDELRFRDLAGVEHSAQGPFAVDGAFGYTVYLTDGAVEGAAVQIPLL